MILCVIYDIGFHGQYVSLQLEKIGYIYEDNTTDLPAMARWKHSYHRRTDAPPCHQIKKNVVPITSYVLSMDIEQIRIYCLSKTYATEDMPFGPEYVVFRIGGKIFCCLALVLGNVVQLKWNPDEFDEVIDKYPYVCQAWHWHKRHMIQFDLDEASVPDSVVKNLIDRAY